MYTVVKEYCKSCPKCQLTSNYIPAYAPLSPSPVIDMPFERIGVDVVGPLERSQSGNRFILVICDYATRYPEAYPLREVTAKQVANVLLRLFTQVGIPKEVLTDQGPNFMSRTLQQVYQVLGIKRVRTTPYHPQTDGLVERFKKNLEKYAEKVCFRDWKRLGQVAAIPAVCVSGGTSSKQRDFLLLNSCTLTQSEVLLMF